MNKLTRALKREIREDIRRAIAGQIRLITVGDYPIGPMKDYHDQVIAELADQVAGQQLNAVAYTRELIDRQRPGIAEIREELRRNGIPEEAIDGEAKAVWEFRHRNGPEPRRPE